MAKRIQGITIELDGETRPLQKALQDVDKQSRDLQNELREVERLLKFDPGNAEALAQKQQLLNKQIETTTERLNRLRAVQQQVEQQFERGEIGAEQYRAFRREIQATEARLKNFEEQLASLDGKALDGLKKRFQDVQTEVSNTQASVDELSGAIAGLAAGGTVAGAVSAALESASLDTQIDVSFDVPPESVAAVKDAVATVTSYIGDQQAALEGVRRQWALNADASDTANARIVQGAAAIARAYAGIDFAELIQEVNEVSKSLGISNDEALGLVNSLLKMGFPPEQLDIISEYGLQLQRAGYEAEEIQAIFAAGLQTGTWNIDNLLDGLKEGRIRLAEFGQEVPKAVKDLLAGTNISAQQLQKWGQAVAQGGDAGKRAMVEVARAINGIDNETKKNALGVAVWGTMWEDQGQAIIDTILGAKNQVVDLKANQDQLNAAVQQLDEDPTIQFAQAMHELKVALGPILTDIANFISKIAEWIKNNPQLAATITAIVGALGIFAGILATLGPLIAGITAFVGALAAIFGVATSTVWIIIGVIAALIAIGVALWKNWDTIKAKAAEVWNGLVSFFQSFFASVKATFDNALNWIDSVTGGRFSSVTNAIRNYMNMAWNNLKLVWNFIKNTFRNALDFVKALVSDDFEGMKRAISNQMDNIKSTIRRIWDNIKNFLRNINLKQIGRDIIRGLLDGIVSLKNRVLQKAQEIADGIKSRIKSALGIESPSKVMMDFGKDTVEGFILGIQSMLGNIRRVSDQLAQTAIQPTSDAANTSRIENTGNIPRIATAPVEIQVMLDGRQIMPTIRRELTFDLDAALKRVR